MALLMVVKMLLFFLWITAFCFIVGQFPIETSLIYVLIVVIMLCLTADDKNEEGTPRTDDE